MVYADAGYFLLNLQKILILILNLGELMSKITVYEKPTCTTCRKVVKALEENGVNFIKVNYFIEPFTKARLKTLLKKMGMKPSELLRTREKEYKELDLKNRDYSEEEILNLMVENPNLVQRPIIEKGDKAILARPPEKIRELF